MKEKVILVDGKPLVARDFRGRILKVGDPVIGIERGYKDLRKGVITKIMPKMLEFKSERSYAFRQFHNQVIKDDFDYSKLEKETDE